IPARMSPQIYLPVDERAAQRSQMADFLRRAAQVSGRDLRNYAELQAWACTNYRDFWRLALDYFQLDTAGTTEPVCTGDQVETAIFFPNLKLNYAQSLLRPLPGAPDAHPAVIHVTEAGERRERSRGELKRQALAVAARLQAAGVKRGDRVVALARN